MRSQRKNSTNLQSLILLIIAIFPFALYYSSFNYPLYFDSLNALSIDHLGTRESMVWNGLGLFEKRGLFWITILSVKKLFGYSAQNFRILSVTIHSLNGIMLFLVIKQFLQDLRKDMIKPSHIILMGLATLLFVSHPVAIYAVAYTAQANTLIATLLALISTYFFLRAARNDNKLQIVISIIFYSLALSAKEHVILLPVLFFIWDWIQSPIPFKQFLKERLLLYVGHAIPATYTLFLHMGIFGTNYEPWAGAIQQASDPIKGKSLIPIALQGDATLFRHIENQSLLFFKYLRFWIYPDIKSMAIDLHYDFPLNVAFDVYLMGFIGFVGVGLGCAVSILRKNGFLKLTFFILMPIVLFLPEFSVVRYNEMFVLYRSYLWFIWFAALIFFVFQRLHPIVAIILLALAVISTTYFTSVKLKTFASPFALWSDAVRVANDHPSKYSGSFRPYIFLGGHQSRHGRNEEALNNLLKAKELNPHFTLIHYNLGLIYNALGKTEEAISAFKQALELSPKDSATLYNLANTYLRSNLANEAIPLYLRSIDAYPSHADSHHNLAIAYVQEGDFRQALYHYEETLRLQPNHPKALSNMGNALMMNKQYVKAIKTYQTLLKTQPADPIILYNMGYAFYKTDSPKAALEMLDLCLELNPNIEAAVKLKDTIKKDKRSKKR